MFAQNTILYLILLFINFINNNINVFVFFVKLFKFIVILHIFFYYLFIFIKYLKLIEFIFLNCATKICINKIMTKCFIIY